jgi:hypothetical protein
MSRSDAIFWKEAFNKDSDKKALAQCKVFVVERTPDRNPLGTAIDYKYKIDRIKNRLIVSKILSFANVDCVFEENGRRRV